MYESLLERYGDTAFADFTKASEEELRELRSQPGVPADYVAFLEEVGWGELGVGWSFMFYSGPEDPGFVYPDWQGPSGSLLFGDDMQGYCMAFDGKGGLIEFDPRGRGEPEEGTFRDFLEKRLKGGDD
ncbi:MAG: SMI1/KNR4 family protein [Acidobacteriota bacterium]